jgi:hypothetical protein
MVKTARNLILTYARNTFNQFCIQITLAEIAEKMYISMSKINNHFLGPNQKTILTRVTESWNFDQKGLKNLVVALTHTGLMARKI